MKNTLINEKLLKRYSPIPLDFNMQEIENYVKISELIWVLPILGDALYEELLYQVKENQVSEENSTLLTEAVYPYIGFAICLEALPMLWARVSETGIQLGKSDNADSATLKDMTYIEGHLRRQVEARKDFLIKWLDSHCGSFPLYHPTNCGLCCGNNKKLNKPNPSFEVYSPFRRRTKLL